jgi:hypothetical protein
VLNGAQTMTGRITERHLPQAERCFPGIRRFYNGLSHKPATFLQLVWAYEAEQMRQRTTKAQPRSRHGR